MPDEGEGLLSPRSANKCCARSLVEEVLWSDVRSSVAADSRYFEHSIQRIAIGIGAHYKLVQRMSVGHEYLGMIEWCLLEPHSRSVSAFRNAIKSAFCVELKFKIAPGAAPPWAASKSLRPRL